MSNPLNVNPYLENDEQGNKFPLKIPNLEYGKPENFPVDNLPDLLKAVAIELSQCYRVPVCLPAMAGFGVVSGAVGKSVVVRGVFHDKGIRLNLYVIAVAERGIGKSLIGSTLCPAIMTRSKELAEEHQREMSSKKADVEVLRQQVNNLIKSAGNLHNGNRLEDQEELHQRQAKLDELSQLINKDTKLWVDNITSEALAKCLQDNDETLLAYSPEAGGAIKVILGKYTDSKSDIDLWLNGYSGDPASLDRKGSRSVQLSQPCLSILWMVQRKVMEDLIGNPEVFERGFTARCLIFDLEARKEYETGNEGRFTLSDKWNATIRKLIDDRVKSLSPNEIGCGASAVEVFRAFENERIDLERYHFPDFTGELSRARENAVKLAGIIALLSNESIIAETTATRAVEIVRWQIFNYLNLLQRGRLEKLKPDLKRIMDILSANNGEIKIGELEKCIGFRREEIDNIARQFPKVIVVENPHRGGVGRPSVVVRAYGKSSKFMAE